ncbi:hypothetical protein JKA74_15655 [Marivirga sp. S37H4]|uniref:Uncharacterized protein n=1 Tax=Marivirga aurantiaca TaxID=2802615 RepID=A0A934X197_9BACT|nr:hypothetical protein [Marivirga aurantiaca]MBK6266480.1 hypothetical protein [Marivirga aurantiaca]
MAKDRSDHLFTLVKSLNRSEKRYFKLFVSHHEEMGAKYIRLFEMIEKQNKFDENTILQKETSFEPAQFSNLKAHLYKRLLQSLRQYELEKIEEIQIREMVDYVQLLFNRGLYQQSVDMLGKAHKKVRKTDNLELKLELLKWEKIILNKTVGASFQQRVHRIIEQVEDTNRKINLINKFTNLSVQLNAVYLKTGYIRNDAHYLEIKELFYHNMPEHKEEELSLYEKLNLYRLYVNYYYFTEEMESGYEYAKRWLKLFDKNPELRQSQMDEYLNAINQVMIAEYKLFHYADFMKTRKRLQALNQQTQKIVNENIRYRLLKYVFVHEFNRIFMLGKFNIGVSLLDRIGEDLGKFIARSDEHSRIILFYKIACLYFGNSQYSEALEWINRVQNDENVELREDIHSFTRILSLIAHYELGNMEVIDYYIRSAYRFLLKKGDLNLFQKYILRFLRKLASGFQEEDLIPEFKKLLEQLIPLQSIRYEKRAFIYFDIISWLESKIQHRTVQEVIQEKAKKQILG